MPSGLSATSPKIQKARPEDPDRGDDQGEDRPPAQRGGEIVSPRSDEEGADDRGHHPHGGDRQGEHDRLHQEAAPAKAKAA